VRAPNLTPTGGWTSDQGLTRKVRPFPSSSRGDSTPPVRVRRRSTPSWQEIKELALGAALIVILDAILVLAWWFAP